MLKNKNVVTKVKYFILYNVNVNLCLYICLVFYVYVYIFVYIFYLLLVSASGLNYYGKLINKNIFF